MNVRLEALGPTVWIVALQHVYQVVDVRRRQPQRFDLKLRALGGRVYITLQQMSVDLSTLLSFVSQGTLGMQSLREENAALMDCVLRLSFLFDPTPNLFRLSARIGPTPSPEKNTDSCNKQAQSGDSEPKLRKFKIYTFGGICLFHLCIVGMVCVLKGVW